MAGMENQRVISWDEMRWVDMANGAGGWPAVQRKPGLSEGLQVDALTGKFCRALAGGEEQPAVAGRG